MVNEPNKPQKNRSKSAVIAIVVIVLIVLGIYLFQKKPVETAPVENATPENATPAVTPSAPAPEALSQPDNGTLSTPKTLSPFSLIDDEGHTFTNDNLQGHWTLLFFGFSRCGDVCPTTLSQLNKFMEKRQQDFPDQPLPQVVMISVDPETDSPEVLHNYVKNFNPHFIGATADIQTLDTFSKELGMHYEKVPQGSHGYMMNHTADLYLINPDGHMVAVFTYPHEDADLAERYEAKVKAHNTES